MMKRLAWFLVALYIVSVVEVSVSWQPRVPVYEPRPHQSSAQYHQRQQQRYQQQMLEHQRRQTEILEQQQRQYMYDRHRTRNSNCTGIYAYRLACRR